MKRIKISDKQLAKLITETTKQKTVRLPRGNRRLLHPKYTENKTLKEQGPDGGIPTGRKPSNQPIARPDEDITSKKKRLRNKGEKHQSGLTSSTSNTPRVPRCFRIDAGGCLECPPEACNNQNNPCPYPTMADCEEAAGVTGPLYTELYQRQVEKLKEESRQNLYGKSNRTIRKQDKDKARRRPYSAKARDMRGSRM